MDVAPITVNHRTRISQPSHAPCVVSFQTSTNTYTHANKHTHIYTQTHIQIHIYTQAHAFIYDYSSYLRRERTRNIIEYCHAVRANPKPSTQMPRNTGMLPFDLQSHRLSKSHEILLENVLQYSRQISGVVAVGAAVLWRCICV